MNRVRLLACACLMAAVVPAPEVGAETPPAVVELGKRSVFTANKTSAILVDLPQRQPFYDPDVFRLDLHGDGRIFGYMLVQQGVRLRDAAMIHSLRPGGCKARGCEAEKDGVGFVFGSNVRNGIPKGIYRLYLIADGAPVTVTIRASSLSGRVSARPTDRVHSDLRSLTPRVDVADADTTYSAGDYTDLEGPDFAFIGLWWDTDLPAAVSAFGSCVYYDDDGYEDPPEDRAFLPGCPQGDSHPSAFPSGDVVSTYSIHTDQPYGAGAWYSTTSPVSKHGAVGFWLNF